MHTEDVVEAMISERSEDLSVFDNQMSRPPPMDRPAPREMSMQVEEPQPQTQPQGQQPKQRRFRMPWSSSTKDNKQTAAPQESTVETTMISDFNYD
jgi:hypothetical protein